MQKILSSLFIILILSACTKPSDPSAALPDIAETEKTITDVSKSTKERTAALNTPIKSFEIQTEVINEETHWAPKEFKAKKGSTVQFIAKHKITSGPNFHGFSISAFGIAEQVYRGKDRKIKVEIPEDTEVGEYTIGCQFHAAHKGSKLIIEE